MAISEHICAQTCGLPSARLADPFANLGDHLHDVARSAEDAAIRAAHDSEWTPTHSARALERCAGVLRTIAVMHAAGGGDG